MVWPVAHIVRQLLLRNSLLQIRHASHLGGGSTTELFVERCSRSAEKDSAVGMRLVQYKMSLKGRAIPIQDEPDGDPLGGQEQSSCGRWESPCSKPNR